MTRDISDQDQPLQPPSQFTSTHWSAAAQVRHSNIVSVHEVGREDNCVYIVSDFVEGASLADWMTGQRL